MLLKLNTACEQIHYLNLWLGLCVAKMADSCLMSLTFQCDTDDGISSDSESPTSIHSLIRQMQEKERRILQLEAEVAKVCIVKWKKILVVA